MDPRDLLDRPRFELHVESNEPFKITLSPSQMFALGLVVIAFPKPRIRQLGVDPIQLLLGIGASIVLKNDLKHPSDIAYHLTLLVDFCYTLARDHRWKTDADIVLSICYLLLVNRKITREESAIIAQQLMPVHAPKSVNSWRVRVDAYAKQLELPPIGQPLRKARMKSAKANGR